jgi:hypothetical protein
MDAEALEAAEMIEDIAAYREAIAQDDRARIPLRGLLAELGIRDDDVLDSLIPSSRPTHGPTPGEFDDA